MDLLGRYSFSHFFHYVLFLFSVIFPLIRWVVHSVYSVSFILFLCIFPFLTLHSPSHIFFGLFCVLPPPCIFSLDHQSSPGIILYFSVFMEAVRQCLFSVVYSFRYNYDWKIEEAQKNVLRTHTTAVSARQLYKLAQEVGLCDLLQVSSVKRPYF